MNLEGVLEGIGLSEKEAKVYLAVLALREALPSTIAKKAAVKRPTAYVVLEQLQAKGLVSRVKRQKALFYRALNPQALVGDQQNRFLELEKALPDLLSLHETYCATPQMTVFEGRDGLIQIMEDTLSATSIIHNWNDVSMATSGPLRDYYATYIEKRVKRKIAVRALISRDEKALQFLQRAQSELREMYLVPKDKYPFRNEINIYDDKVSILSHEDSIGVIIQNRFIADTQRSIFQFAFEYARLLDEQSSTSGREESQSAAAFY